MAKYKVTEKRITDYLPDPSNANKGSELGQEVIERSLQEVGPGRSLVADKNGILVAGNKTQQGAVDAGISQVLEIETEGDVVIVHKRKDWDITEGDGGEARRYAYFDNRASELSMTWDPVQIKLDVDMGINLKGIFTDDDLKKLMNKLDGSDSPASGNNTSSGQVEKAEEIRAKWGVEKGQLWLIPSKFKEGLVHRVLCGDSTSESDVDRLMNGRKAALSVTSPPYSVNKDYEKEAVEDWLKLIRGVFTQCARISDLWFVNLADRRTGNEGAFEVHTYGKMIEECAKLGYGLLSTRIWKKPPVWGTNPYWRTTYKGLDDFEYLAMFGKEAPKRVDRLTDDENTDWGYRGVWEFASVQANALHSAQFPVELPNRAMRMLTDYGDLVHDPFGGSGTTMKAAELIGREAYLMELMPHYTAVVLETMSELGLEPRLEA
jgi:DNA modification methylase